eukprot:1192356-Prorocentrum_minimum.AAC.2
MFYDTVGTVGKTCPGLTYLKLDQSAERKRRVMSCTSYKLGHMFTRGQFERLFAPRELGEPHHVPRVNRVLKSHIEQMTTGLLPLSPASTQLFVAPAPPSPPSTPPPPALLPSSPPATDTATPI